MKSPETIHTIREKMSREFCKNSTRLVTESGVAFYERLNLLLESYGTAIRAEIRESTVAEVTHDMVKYLNEYQERFSEKNTENKKLLDLER